MAVFLFLLGILLTGVGLFLVGFSIPFRDFSLGNTLIVSGAISIAGGLILIALAATLRELRKIAKNLEAGAVGVRTAAVAAVAAAAVTPAARAAPPAAAPAPPRQPPKLPPVVNTTRSLRAEPRLDPNADTGAPEPPMPPAPTVADITAERPRGGLFASIRGRSQATPQVTPPVAQRPRPNLSPPPPPPPGPAATSPDFVDEDHPLPPPPPSLRGGLSERTPFHPEDDVSPSPPTRSPSLSALAARTAARLDLPRPVPDLPRVATDRTLNEPPAFERREPELPPEPELEQEPPEKPSRNMFDSVWPHGGKAPPDDTPDDEPPPEPAPPEILKSGVIDGMAYTLYTDGSIEAQLPQGTLRFTSIDDLRAHLERGT